MNCKEFAGLKHDLLDDALPEDVARGACAHAEQCTGCGGELASLRRVRQALRCSTPEPLSLAARVRVMGALLVAVERSSSPSQIMTLPEVAAYLRLTESAVHAALGSLPYFTVAGEVRFRRESLERWIEREEARPAGLGLTGSVLTLITSDAAPGALAV